MNARVNVLIVLNCFVRIRACVCVSVLAACVCEHESCLWWILRDVCDSVCGDCM